jgi:hypothetical protein
MMAVPNLSLAATRLRRDEATGGYLFTWGLAGSAPAPPAVRLSSDR